MKKFSTSEYFTAGQLDRRGKKFVQVKEFSFSETISCIALGFKSALILKCTKIKH